MRTVGRAGAAGDWLASRWIVAYEPSREGIADLMAVADRDLKDAAIAALSSDQRLGIGRV